MHENAHAGEFVLFIAAISSILAIVAILSAIYLYYYRYKALQARPPARRPDDPLRPMLGPIFTLLENKYWVDELYWTVILNPYIALSRFLAEVVDWRFWHDWFHNVVIARTYRWLASVLAVQIDLGVIDATANGLANVTKRLASQMRRIQTGYVRTYALSVFLGVVLILGYLILR